MRSTPSLNTAPWQISAVSAAGRIAAASLFAIALDSLFIWKSTPNVIVALAFIIVPLVVAIRVIRGFPLSIRNAALTFAAAQAMALGVLGRPGQASDAQLLAVVAVAAIVSATGLVAIAADALRIHRPRPAVIELSRPEQDGLVVAGRRTRQSATGGAG
jgi:hypothetical protein